MITNEEYAAEHDRGDGTPYAWLCAGPCGCVGDGVTCRCACFGCGHHCGACHCRARHEDPDWPTAGPLAERNHRVRE